MSFTVNGDKQFYHCFWLWCLRQRRRFPDEL
ncbi:hypothetical protein [Rahnella perminowiae]